MTSAAARRLTLPLAATALAWWYTIVHCAMSPQRALCGSRAMDERSDLLSLAAMWSIMMIAMMLPATLPWIAAAGTRFVAGYSLVWIAIGVVAANVQWRFGSVLVRA